LKRTRERERERERGGGGGRGAGAEKGAEKTHCTPKETMLVVVVVEESFFSFPKLTFAKWQNFLQKKLLLPKISLYLMVLAKTS